MNTTNIIKIEKQLTYQTTDQTNTSQIQQNTVYTLITTIIKHFYNR